MLTEVQRVAAIRLSGTDGGDGTTARISLLVDSILDFSLLGNLATFGMLVNETSDTFHQSLSVLRIGEGILTIQMNETLDISSILNIDLEKIYIANDTNKVKAFDMTNCFNITVEGADSDTFVIRLKEQDRVNAMYFGNSTVAGDGSPALVVLDGGAVFDIAGYNRLSSFVLMGDFTDKIKPFYIFSNIIFWQW